MATTVTTAGRAVVRESNWLKALTNWIRNHKQAAAYLGAAYENALRPKDAATAYEAAAAAALYPFLRAQFLSDAGRAWLAAGDTAQALAGYRTITEQLDSTSAAGEAKVRLGELTKGSGHP